MKRSCVVKPKSANKSVKASTSNKQPIKASNAWFDKVRARIIKRKLTELMDIVESCDNETYEAIDGEPLWDTLLLHAQQIDMLLNPME